MKKLIYLLITVFNPVLSNSVYSNLLFRVNSIRLKRPYYKLDIDYPKTFTEKINYIKFNIRNDFSAVVADKFEVRKFVAKRAGEQVLIPLLKVYDRPEEIDLSRFDEDIILKMTNGSGGNLMVRKGHEIRNDYAIKFFKKNFKKNIYLFSREWHYKNVKPKIVAEKLLSDNLNDYKFFCTKDGPFAVQVDVDRFTNHKRNLYDLDWNLLPYKIRYENSDCAVPKPENLNRMIEVSKKLCADFMFSRIDLYDFEDTVYFGEITLHPGGGGEPFDSKASDLAFGKYVDLNFK